MTRHGPWQVDIQQLPDANLQAAIDAFVAVYQTSWKGPEPNPRFIPALARTAAAQGWLRLGVRLHTGAHHSDPSSGFRGFSAPLVASFAADYPLDYLESVESLITAHLLGFSVAEVPITGRTRVSGVPSHRGHRLGFHYLRMWMALMLLRRRRAS